MAKQYRTAVQEDIAFLRRTEQQAFLCSTQEIDRYIGQVSLESFRVLLEDGEPVGALTILPQAQWWLGQKIPMAGLASVSVLPEARRRGNASALVKATLTELHEKGLPLSVLYSAADPLYRAMGYGIGGTSGLWQVPVHRIGSIGVPQPIRPVPLAAHRLRPLQQQYARHHGGHLDRHPSIWKAIARTDETRLASSAYLVGPADAPEGYLVLYPESGETPTLHILDWAFTTPEAGRSLWGFLAQMDTQLERVRWRGGAIDPMALLLPDSTASLAGLQYWWLRLVDVPKALAARGYPKAIAATLDLEVIDPVLPANQGCWSLSVAAGRGTVTPGSAAQITLSVDHLASLYSGLISPYQLRQMGQLQGSDAGMAIAAALFAGPAPWLPDFF